MLSEDDALLLQSFDPSSPIGASCLGRDLLLPGDAGVFQSGMHPMVNG